MSTPRDASPILAASSDVDPRPFARTSPPFAPRPVTLTGRLARLEPLGEHHIGPLVALGIDPETWRWMRDQPENGAELEAYLRRALDAAATRREIPFVQVDVVSGTAAGMTRFLAIEPDHRRLEIGHTWLAPPFRGTGHNAEAKLLLLRHAFEDLGAARVEFKTDANNVRSRAALLAIGATEEGTLRRHIATVSGRVRDSVYFSVIWEEWPSVRATLEARVERAVGRASATDPTDRTGAVDPVG